MYNNTHFVKDAVDAYRENKMEILAAARHEFESAMGEDYSYPDEYDFYEDED